MLQYMYVTIYNTILKQVCRDKSDEGFMLRYISCDVRYDICNDVCYDVGYNTQYDIQYDIQARSS